MGIMDGKVCIVTGGAGSIGLASAALLLREGAKVMLVGHNEENLKRAAKALNASNDSLDILKEAYLAAVVHPWPIGSKPARTCLAMSTREGARALGLGHEIGTVEVGKKADLIMLDVDHARMTPLHDLERALIYAGRGSDVEVVVVDGQVVLEDGILTRVDEARVLHEARERAARIFSPGE